MTDAIDDGRPCVMDIFVMYLLNDTNEHYQLRDALEAWTEGDWPTALSYLSEESRRLIGFAP